ncbi:MAG: mechanosensitive ion channel family protein [Pseudomonadota bacterium]
MRSFALIFMTVLFLAGFGQSPAEAQIFNNDNLLRTTPQAAQPESAGSQPQSERAPVSAADLGITDSQSMPMIGTATDAVDRFRRNLVDSINRVPGVVPALDETLATASVTGRATYFLGVALFCSLLLMIGRAAFGIFGAYIARPLFVSAQRPNPQGYLEKLPVLAYRVLLSIVGVAIMIGVGASVGLFFYQDHEPTMITAVTIFAGYGLFMLMNVIWRMALSPYLPRYRLPVIGDQEAQRLFVWLVGLSGLGVGGMAFSQWLAALGMDPDHRVLIVIALNLIGVIALLALIRVNRRTVDRIILAGKRPQEASLLTLFALRIWAPVIVIYLIAAWGKLSYRLISGSRGGDETMIVPYAVLMAGLLAYAVASYVIERIFTRRIQIDELNKTISEPAPTQTPEDRPTGVVSGDSPDDGGDDDEGGGLAPMAEIEEDAAVPPMRTRRVMRSFEDLARRVASLLAIGAAAWVLLYYWGGFSVFAENAFLGIAEDVVDILLIGYVIYHAMRIWMDQKIAAETADEVATGPLDGEGGGAGATRLATLLPLVRNFVLSLILIAIGLVAATELGVNVAPLFAGAGIIGLAIGFGSQTLVRDILSGAFFLVDDAFRKGEYIDVGDVKGTVEKISLRSFQLRHHLGMLHTIPFGEVKFLTNFSRDWVMMKLPLRVTYDTDVDRVRKLIKKLGQDLMDDPVVGPNFIQPLKSQGVIEMDDSAMIIRVKFMTKPGDQWVVRKRVYQEIRALFEHEGIKFAHREVTVRIPDLPQDRDLTEPEVRAIGGAARSAVEQTQPGLAAARADDR